jgi:hypothetical protein
VGCKSRPPGVETLCSLNRRLKQLRDYKEIDYEEIFFDLVGMGVFTVNDIDIFWDFPSHRLFDFYQQVKTQYYKRINEQNISVAKLNVNILAAIASFGKGKFNSEQVFKDSLPFNPDQLEITNSELSTETLNILEYYVQEKIIPDRIVNTMFYDPDFKQILLNIKRKQ